MTRLVPLALVLLSAVPAAAADKPPVYLWLEPEWFDGVTGSFAYWTGEAKPTGSWGVAGPGISAEWTQGGESEWNSAAASADETKGAIYQDIEIPRAGNYKLWVRYADWANRSERHPLGNEGLQTPREGLPTIVGRAQDEAIIALSGSPGARPRWITEATFGGVWTRSSRVSSN